MILYLFYDYVTRAAVCYYNIFGWSYFPVHDALLFPKNKKEEGIRILTTAFKEVTGAEGAIKEEL